jgi:hypothetical protein
LAVGTDGDAVIEIERIAQAHTGHSDVDVYLPGGYGHRRL